MFFSSKNDHRNGRCSCTEQRRRLTQAFQSPTPIPSLRSLKRCFLLSNLFFHKKSRCIFPCFKGALFTFHIITIPPGSWGQEENVKGPKDCRKNQKKEHRNEIIGEIGTKDKTGTIVLQNSITKKTYLLPFKASKVWFSEPTLEKSINANKGFIRHLTLFFEFTSIIHYLFLYICCLRLLFKLMWCIFKKHDSEQSLVEKAKQNIFSQS